MEEVLAHAPMEKRVLAKEMRPMKSRGGALHRNRNVPPMEKRVVADKKTAHGELLDITPTMSSLIEVQCVTME